MSLIASRSESKKEYEPVPAGTHVARLYQIIEIGTVEGEYMGKPTQKRKVRLTFELPNEKKVFKEEEGPKPLIISGEFTLSMGSMAKLRPFVHGMLGVTLKDEEAESFDILTLIGTPCILNVAHTEKSGKKYANIISAMPLMKGMEAPSQVNSSQILTYQKWDAKIYESLPAFIKDKMSGTPEMSARVKYNNNPIAKELLDAQGKVDKDEIEFPTEEIDPNDIPF